MDQAQFILAQVQSGGLVLTNIQAIGTGLTVVISTFIMWGFMTKNINEKIKGKADEKETKQRFLSLESNITDIKSSAKEDRALFLIEVRELRGDLKLKKDKP